ncbi:leukemia inhibitory factor receptor isoform X1 [Centroberyx gerrardi]
MSLMKSLLFNLLVLFLTLSEDHSGFCKETDWTLPRPNISHLQAINETQSLVVGWLVDHSSLLEKSDNYEIQIGRTENLTIIYNSNVSAHPVGSDVYTWTWTSTLPLQCADHSVRIRRFYNQSIPSPWSNWMTNYGVGADKSTRIFPLQQVLREGTSAMFCCVPGRGVHITSMALNGTKYPLISIGGRVKAITIKHLTISRVLFTCTDTTANLQYCYNYISFPPQKPRNLSCATADLTTVTCTWDPGRRSNLFNQYRRTHTLHINNGNADQDSSKCTESKCSFLAVPNLEEYDITVVVRNQLGEERESYSFNLSDRVFPVVEWNTVHPGVTDTTVTWILQGNLSTLDILCQVTTKPESTIMVTGQSEGGYYKVKLEHLLPNTCYSTSIRCAVKGKLWGDWAQPLLFTTYPLVTLDVWRRVKQLPNPHNLREVTLLWTPHIPGSAAKGVIQGYTVQWSQGGQNRTEGKDSGQTQAEIFVGPGQCDFSVQAVLLAGSSIPAHITVPQMEDREILLPVQRVSGSTAGGFHLSWAEQHPATCGYTVEWCTPGTANPCALRWMKVPNGNNTLFLPAGNFTAGYRYTFNIYGCMENGHRLLEIQTGYSQELKPLQSPSLVRPGQSTSSSVTLEWLYNEEDQAHRGFITGYLVVVQEEGCESTPGQTANLLNVTDPRRKIVTIDDLHESQVYTFCLSAVTKGGPGPPASIIIKTTANYSVHLAKILTPVLLLLGCTILLWPQRKMLTSGLKGIFAYPAGMNINTIEVDNFLRETSERLQSQTVEECVSCDIEILPAGTPVTETTTLIDPELLNAPSSSASQSSTLSSSALCMPPQADYRPQSTAVRWESPVFQQVTSVTNQSYCSTIGGDFSEPQQVAPKGISEINSLESSESLQESWSVMSGYISNDALSV